MRRGEDVCEGWEELSNSNAGAFPVHTSFPLRDPAWGANSMTSPPFLAFSDERHVRGLMKHRDDNGRLTDSSLRRD